MPLTDPVASNPRPADGNTRSLCAELFWLPLIITAVLMIYLPGLANVPLFDDEYLTSGQLFELYKTFEVRVRAVSYGSFVWLHAHFGEGWWKQRLANIFVHVATVLALWGLYREILRHIAAPSDADPRSAPYYRSPALGLAIGFFALNPVAVYAVAYLIQRSILLATFFTVLGFWLFVLGVRARQWWLHSAALICYALAVLSKEHAILAPLAAIPLYILVARPKRRHLLALTLVGTCLIGGVAALLVYRYGEILGKPFDEYSHVYLDQLAKLEPNAVRNAYPLSILNQAFLFFHYAFLWIVPASGWMSINLRPPFPVTWLTFPHVFGIAGYAAVVLSGFFMLLKYRDWRALLGVSMLFPALLFATEFATVWVQDPFVLYRSYLWAIGVPGIVFLLVHGPKPRTLATIGLVLGVLLIWQAQDRVFSLATPEKAWTDAIRKLPDDPRSVGRWVPYLNRGSVYVEQDQLGLAIKDFEASAALGDTGMGAMNLGAVLSARGKHKEALAAFKEAERQGYNLYNLPFQRGLALLALGNPAEAMHQFDIAMKLDPPSPTREINLLHLGRVALEVQRRDVAVAVLSRLVNLDPRHREGRYLLGMAYVTQGEHEKAREILDSLIADDRNGRAYYARALANYGLKRKPEAVADIDLAIRLGPDTPHLREWQARIQAMP